MVEWSSTPATWPSDVGDGVTLERATFAIDSLRVVGDAGPGDPRTTATALEARWDDSTTPEPILFTDAPTGLYSQLSINLDGHLITDSFDIKGTATYGSDTRDLKIESDNPLMVTVQIETNLVPPSVATVKLRVDFKAAIDAIDFSMVDVNDGNFEISDGDSQMVVFRKALLDNSFIVVDGSSMR